jgi:hypothetical protein
MNRFFTLIFLLLLSVVEASPRIMSLLGPLDAPLAVEPYIPSNFEATSKTGTLDMNDWVYWGPKEVVESYFLDPTSLKQSLIRVRLSQTVRQNGPDRFNSENDDLCKLMAPLGLKRLFDVRMQWGKYPIYCITAEFDKKWLYTAWVGLSDPQGTTLMFELVYPGKKPSTTDFELWDQFLDKTRIAPEPIYGDSFRLSYAPGATDVAFYGEKFALIGEQRYSDKLIQIVVDPKKSGFAAVIDTVHFAFISEDPTKTGPGAKVFLSLTKDTNRYTQMIPLLIKPVESFSQDGKGKATYEQKLHCMLKEYLKSL